MKLRAPLIATALLAASAASAQMLVPWTEGQGRLGLGYPVPVPVDTPLPFEGFRTYEGLHARHQDLLLGSEVVDGAVVGETHLGREIWAYRLGGPGELTPEGLPKSAVMFAGGVHAREWQSPEVVTGLMELMAENHDDGHWLNYLRDHVNMVVVPVVNVDGFIQTQRFPRDNWLDVDPVDPKVAPRDGRMRRKNHNGADEDLFTEGDLLNGVDLNRNNPPFWPGVGRTRIPEDLLYSGQAEQSEPEIHALVTAALFAPESRLRFYSDMHSFGRVFFGPNTFNFRRNGIQSRVFGVISSHHVLLPGGKRYSYVSEPINSGIGTTSEYFAHTFAIPSATWEIEPGRLVAVEYGGFDSNEHSGFILPDREVPRVRENLAESMAAAAYHMAGPPAVIRAEVYDAATDALVWSARWSEPETGLRELVERSAAALEPGREYRLWVAFDKPMRWREDGEVTRFPGQTPAMLNVSIELLAGGEPLDVAQQSVEWAGEPGPAPGGYYRYRDDALVLPFEIEDNSANGERIAAAAGTIELTVDTADLTGHRLDADPATPVDWDQGHWSGYEGEDGTEGDEGGTDRTLALPVSLEADGSPALLERGHTGAWFDPRRNFEGWSIEILGPDSALGYWFTYDEDGGQRWLIGTGEIRGNRIVFPELLATSGGRFGPDFDPEEVKFVNAGTATIVFTGCDHAWLEYRAFDHHRTLDLVRLTRTMEIDCAPPDDAVVTASARQTGSWFDPTHEGEGFTLQWLVDGKALVTWFSYDPEGNQYWMQGIGEPDGDRIRFPKMTARQGARFGDAFDPEDAEPVEWGELTMELDCSTGTAQYASLLPEFGEGNFELERLTVVDGFDCEE